MTTATQSPTSLLLSATLTKCGLSKVESSWEEGETQQELTLLCDTAGALTALGDDERDEIQSLIDELLEVEGVYADHPDNTYAVVTVTPEGLHLEVSTQGEDDDEAIELINRIV